MKRFIAIFLLCCFGIYHFGYYVAYFSFNLQIENTWVDKIYGDKLDGLEERFLEIPMTLPYMADEEEFRPSNTRFEKDGQHFRAVKQRYVNDTLQIVYVPDTTKNSLDNTIKTWISSLVQDELPDSGNNTLLSKTFVKDYIQPENQLVYGFSVLDERQLIGFIFSAYQSQYLNLNTPPPELFS
ncbi:hypothetical protein [Mongoliibacter ruber]|uniref:Uncharacterized protein n=1 Tax=Mongoliibacter ruber TaxID=1750599 RepID=A0A2T0WSA1_9BACT|nr:hypothetical protein [Mongoliibacter ruber]PRY89579.1 hypothetical protein CLW00_10255 [Mongoliibacter ruber]